MIIVTLLLLVLAAGIALAAIPHDGYGSRPAPHSHIDPFEPRQHVL